MSLLKTNAEAGPEQDLWQQHLLGMLEGAAGSSATYSTYKIWNSNAFGLGAWWAAGNWVQDGANHWS